MGIRNELPLSNDELVRLIQSAFGHFEFACEHESFPDIQFGMGQLRTCMFEIVNRLGCEIPKGTCIGDGAPRHDSTLS